MPLLRWNVKKWGSFAVSRGGTKKTGTAGTKKRYFCGSRSLFSLFSPGLIVISGNLSAEEEEEVRDCTHRGKKKRGKLKLGKFRTQPEWQRHKACVRRSYGGRKEGKRNVEQLFLSLLTPKLKNNVGLASFAAAVLPKTDRRKKCGIGGWGLEAKF